jgi:hypothetical protein
MAKRILVALSLAFLMGTGCKKDRLSGDNYSLHVIPPATTASVGVSETFTVEALIPSGAFGPEADWTISDNTVTNEAFPLFGTSISVTFNQTGLYTLTATYEDRTATTQVRVQ